MNASQPFVPVRRWRRWLRRVLLFCGLCLVAFLLFLAYCVLMPEPKLQQAEVWGAQVSAGLEAYHRAHGRYPERLAELAPGYMSQAALTAFPDPGGHVRYDGHVEEWKYYPVRYGYQLGFGFDSRIGMGTCSVSSEDPPVGHGREVRCDVVLL